MVSFGIHFYDATAQTCIVLIRSDGSVDEAGATTGMQEDTMVIGKYQVTFLFRPS